MIYQTMTHHLILMLNRHLGERFSHMGYTSTIAEEVRLELSGNERTQIKPSLAVFHNSSDQPVMIADVDLQACGRQEVFTEKINQYDRSSVKEHWLFYTKDHIIVVRRKEGNSFAKPIIFGESDLFTGGGLFLAFHTI